MPQSLPSLLLLPPAPNPVTSASLSAAYRPSFQSTISVLKNLASDTELFVVLPCPTLHGRLRRPRSEIHSEVQKLLGGIYSLICVVCAQLGADVDSGLPGSIDARILLLDYTGSQSLSSDALTSFDNSVAGPVIDLPTLAITRRKWDLIFSVDGEAGQKLLADYTGLANQISPPLEGHVNVVSGGVSLIQNVPNPIQIESLLPPTHKVIAVGGTFDHIHAGHKLLLTATALLLQPGLVSEPRRLIVGITGDELLKNKKYAEYLNSWKQRQQDVVDFLLSIISFTKADRNNAVKIASFDRPVPNGRAIHTKLEGCSITIECVEIQDPFGPTITDESITALVVSGETRAGGQAVNKSREEKGWKALEVFEIDVLDASETGHGSGKNEDFASKISSTEIRRRRAEAARTSSL